MHIVSPSQKAEGRARRQYSFFVRLWSLTLNIRSDDLRTDEAAMQRARDEFGHHVRRLTANLLRVSMGGGKPSAIEAQIRELCTAFDAYRELAAESVSGDILASELDLAEIRSRYRPWLDDGIKASAPEEATIMIVDGALEVTVSRLLNQRAPEARGRRRMNEGIRALQRHQSQAF